MKRFQQIAAIMLTLLLAVALFGNNFVLNAVVQAATANESVTEKEGDVDIPIPSTRNIRSISVSTKPTKLIYLQGEKLDTTGMLVRATYSDDSKDFVYDYEVSEIDPNKLGEQTIKVTLSGKTASFQVTVYPLGDANGDLVVDNNDVDALMQYVVGWDNVVIQPLPADVNCDGNINGDDATLLLRYLAKWDVALGK